VCASVPQHPPALLPGRMTPRSLCIPAVWGLVCCWVSIVRSLLTCCLYAAPCPAGDAQPGRLLDFRAGSACWLQLSPVRTHVERSLHAKKPQKAQGKCSCDRWRAVQYLCASLRDRVCAASSKASIARLFF
jgi:hypothetical protein